MRVAVVLGRRAAVKPGPHDVDVQHHEQTLPRYGRDGVHAHPGPRDADAGVPFLAAPYAGPYGQVQRARGRYQTVANLQLHVRGGENDPIGRRKCFPYGNHCLETIRKRKVDSFAISGNTGARMAGEPKGWPRFSRSVVGGSIVLILYCKDGAKRRANCLLASFFFFFQNTINTPNQRCPRTG
uniref:Uncharacterized protein n=1 Tax=Anopheles quadriannulatus TaxID=34691 RepID=A0A182XQ59_ANOQN